MPLIFVFIYFFIYLKQYKTKIKERLSFLEFNGEVMVIKIKNGIIHTRIC